MKKLVAILVICVFAVSLYAVDNPFTFGLSNKITLKGRDASQPGKIADKDTTIGNSPVNDYNVTATALADEMKGSASITIAEIYTLGSYLTGFGELGLGADAYRIQLATGLTNSIKVVPDYLTIGINVDFINRWEAREKTVGTLRIDESVTGVDANGDGDMTDKIYDNDTTIAGNHVFYQLTPQITFGGGIPDSGFSWSLGEKVEMGFNPANYKDSNPKYSNIEGNVYGTDGKMAADVDGDGDSDSLDVQNGVFNAANFITSIGINFEFFHFFAPEGFTGTIKLSHDFKVNVPYSCYLEKDKEIQNEGTYGLEFGLAGVTFGVFAYLKTQDFLNNSAPLNGDTGSLWTWDGSELAENEVVTEDMEATTHSRPNAQLGPKITFGYTKEWFSFGTSYKGYLDGLRKWDESRTNSVIKWNNEFEIYASFSL